MNIHYSDNCPKCNKLNIIDEGGEGCEPDGFECYECGYKWVFDEDFFYSEGDGPIYEKGRAKI